MTASVTLARTALARAAGRSIQLNSRVIGCCSSANNNLLINSSFDHKTRWFASYPSHTVVGMPALSPTMEQGTISKWHVKEGDSFAAGDSLAVIETDKASMDFEAQDDGVVAKVLVKEGTADVSVGTAIMVTVEDTADVGAFASFVAEGAPAAAAPTPAAPAPPAPTKATPAPAPVAAPSSVAAALPTGERIFASPRAHTLAKEKGYGEISALRIVGTGPGGRIIAQDVLNYDPSSAPAVAAPAKTAATTKATTTAGAPAKSGPAPVAGPGYTDYALAAPALELASRLHTSKQNVPHYYLTIDLSLDSLLEMRTMLNSTMKLGDDDAGITVNDLLMKAAAAAMKTVPAANSSWLGDKIRVYDSVDINIVVGNGSSLYAPVIKDVGRKGLKIVSDDAAAATSVVEGGDPTSVPGFGDVGTFTMVNLGMFGVKSCAPIIREPQACALALGVIENRIVPNDDAKSEEIYKESVMMTATLSCDHRVVDGAVGAGWLSAFKNHVENPVTLLL